MGIFPENATKFFIMDISFYQVFLLKELNCAKLFYYKPKIDKNIYQNVVNAQNNVTVNYDI